MIREEIKKFMALAPLMLPHIIGDKLPDDTEITEDCALLYFPLEESLPMGSVMDMLEDDMELVLLYHGTCAGNAKVHHCCFFTSPQAERNMYKFNLASDEKGYVHGLTVSIYSSLDQMEDDLESDLSSHEKSFSLIQAMTDTEVVSLFCSLP